MNRRLRVFLYTLARVAQELETEFYSLEGFRSRCKSSINSFEGRDNKDKLGKAKKQKSLLTEWLEFLVSLNPEFKTWERMNVLFIVT